MERWARIKAFEHYLDLMKLNLLTTAGCLCLSLVFISVSRAADESNVDAILSKYVTASGGKAALEKIKTRVAKIKIESETFGASEGQIYAMAPNKLATHIELANAAGAMDDGFDGTVAWSKNPWQNLRAKSGDELAKAKRDGEFHRILKFKSIYPGLAFKGTEKVSGEEANVLEFKPSATSSEKFWFSAKSGLLIRQDSQFEGPQGAVSSSALPQDYRTVDGIQYPGTLKISFSAGGQTLEMTMKFLEIQHNVKIDEARFPKPAA